jgi:hypothetical protein
MVKRVPSQQVVKPPIIQVSEDNPDVALFAPYEVAIKAGSKTVYSSYQAGPPVAAQLAGMGNASGFIGGDTKYTDPGKTTYLEPKAVLIDTVEPQDIESITYEEYQDASTKITKYRAIIKIRNGSTNPQNVEGVDARLYNPASE